MVEAYFSELDQKMQKFTEKQPRLVDISTTTLFQDDATRHITKLTLVRQDDLQLEVLHHPA